MTALRRQDGFTLVELLVAMAASLVVFGATLSILDSYLHQSAAATKRFDAQDQARIAVDRIVRDLRNVSSPLRTPKLLERATPYDLVFQTDRHSERRKRERHQARAVLRSAGLEQREREPGAADRPDPDLDDLDARCQPVDVRSVADDRVP